jgi:hypothetical protein
MDFHLMVATVPFALDSSVNLYLPAQPPELLNSCNS